MKKRIVVFDNDDTLIDSWCINRYIAEEIPVKLGLTRPPEGAYRQHYGLPWNTFTLEHWGITTEEFYKRFDAAGLKLPDYPAVKGAVEVIGKLKNEYVLGILTSRSRKGTMHLLETAGIPIDNFSFILTHDDTLAHKPDPRVFDAVKEHVKGDFYYVGDNHRSDWPATRDAKGVEFIAVNSPIVSWLDFIKAGVPKGNILKSISELPEWLKVHGDRND